MKLQLDCATFTARSIGFLTADGQGRLCQSCVCVCGIGGMSGAAFVDLPRAGAVRPNLRPESPNHPTWGKPWDAITEKDKRGVVPRECVMTHSSSQHRVDLQIATGICQTISPLLDKTTRTNGRGWFFNLYPPSGSSPWAIAALARPIDWRRFNRRVSA
jgi:hypothetical protein